MKEYQCENAKTCPNKDNCSTARPHSHHGAEGKVVLTYCTDLVKGRTVTVKCEEVKK